MKQTKKCILIGLDGASWDFIVPLIKQGKLPNFSRLMKAGLATTLESTLPPSSPPAWNSIFTGVSPGVHKIYDFVKKKRNSYFIEPISSDDREAPFLWESLQDKRSIAIGIPFSFPPQKINGVFISGLGTPSIQSNFVYPASYKEKILSQFPRFDVDFEEQGFDVEKNIRQIIPKIFSITQEYFQLSKHLFEQERWDFFTVVFRATDVLQHYFINDSEVMMRLYVLLDGYVGWFMDHMDKNTYLLICSDHGFRRVRTRFYLNSWLKKNNFLQHKYRVEKRLRVVINADFLEGLFLKLGVKWLVWKIKRHAVVEFLAKHLLSSSRFDYLRIIDWKRTSFYYVTNTNYLFMNMTDRDPEGLITPEERYAVFEKMKKEALSLRYRGKKVFKELYLLEKVYPKATLHDPDVIFKLDDEFTVSGQIMHDDVQFEPETVRTGEHESKGIFLLFAKNKKMKKHSGHASVIDIAPTILKIFQRRSPIMEGSPLYE